MTDAYHLIFDPFSWDTGYDLPTGDVKMGWTARVGVAFGDDKKIYFQVPLVLELGDDVPKFQRVAKSVALKISQRYPALFTSRKQLAKTIMSTVRDMMKVVPVENGKVAAPQGEETCQS